MPTQVLENIAVAGLLIVAVVAGSLIFQWIQKLRNVNLSYEIVTNDNPAVGIRYAMFLFGMILCFSQVIYRTGTFVEDIVTVVAMTPIVFVAMLGAVFFNEYIILYTFSNDKEVAEEKNVAVAVVEGASYIATAYLVANTLVGFWDHMLQSVLWYFGCQIALCVTALVYGKLVRDVLDSLNKHNVASGLSLGALLVSVGIALGVASSGPASTLRVDLVQIAVFMAGWALMMAVAYFVAARGFVRWAKLRTEVMEQANVAAGVIEGTAFLGFTLLYTFVVTL